MKILVTAASRHGATAEIAAAIGRHLSESGHKVDLRKPEDVDDVGHYDAVVLGSAVYAGQWLHPAYDLVNQFADALRRRPVWLFSSGPPPGAAIPDITELDVSDVVEATGAREHHVFTGCVDRHKLTHEERVTVESLHMAKGDFRDFDDVAHWAASIASALKKAA